MKFYDVSIDPGTNHTGYCFWLNSEVMAIGAIHVPSNFTEFLDKLQYVCHSLEDEMDKLNTGGRTINRIAVEDFEFHTGGHDHAMMKCNTVRGALLHMAWSYTDVVLSVSKQQIKKGETRILAEAYGIVAPGQKFSKDALDAFQIGVCAGFDLKR